MTSALSSNTNPTIPPPATAAVELVPSVPKFSLSTYDEFGDEERINVEFHEPNNPNYALARAELEFEDDNIPAYNHTAYDNPYTVFDLDLTTTKLLRKLNFNTVVHSRPPIVSQWIDSPSFADLAKWFQEDFKPKVDAMLRKHPEGIFIKDYTVSPKDSIEKDIAKATQKKTIEAAKRMYPHIPQLDPETYGVISRTESFKFYAIKSAEDAIKYVISSERCGCTLDACVALNYPYRLHVRPYDDRIVPECEKRLAVLIADECFQCLDDKAYDELAAKQAKDPSPICACAKCKSSAEPAKAVVSDHFSSSAAVKHDCVLARDNVNPKVMVLTSYTQPTARLRHPELPQTHFFAKESLRIAQKNVTDRQKQIFSQKTLRTVVDFSLVINTNDFEYLDYVNCLQTISQLEKTPQGIYLILEFSGYKQLAHLAAKIKPLTTQFIERNPYVKRPTDTDLAPKEDKYIADLFIDHLNIRNVVHISSTIKGMLHSSVTESDLKEAENVTYDELRGVFGYSSGIRKRLKTKMENLEKQATSLTLNGPNEDGLFLDDDGYELEEEEAITDKNNKEKELKNEASKIGKVIVVANKMDAVGDIKEILLKMLDPISTTDMNRRGKWFDHRKTLYSKASDPEVAVSLKDYYVCYFASRQSVDVVPVTFPQFEEIHDAQNNHATCEDEVEFLKKIYVVEEDNAKLAEEARKLIAEQSRIVVLPSGPAKPEMYADSTTFKPPISGFFDFLDEKPKPKPKHDLQSAHAIHASHTIAAAPSALEKGALALSSSHNVATSVTAPMPSFAPNAFDMPSFASNISFPTSSDSAAPAFASNVDSSMPQFGSNMPTILGTNSNSSSALSSNSAMSSEMPSFVPEVLRQPLSPSSSAANNSAEDTTTVMPIEDDPIKHLVPAVLAIPPPPNAILNLTVVDAPTVAAASTSLSAFLDDEIPEK